MFNVVIHYNFMEYLTNYIIIRKYIKVIFILIE